MNNEQKFKVLSSQIQILNKDLEMTEYIMQFAIGEFASAVSRVEQPDYKPEVIESPPIPEVEDDPEEEAEEMDLPEEAPKTQPEPEHKKLFKKIAMLCHPDRLKGASLREKKKKMDLFEKARKAIVKDDYYSLVSVAEELSIETPPPTESQLRSLKSTILKIQSDLTSKKGSFAWIWYHESDPAKKDKIVKAYIKQLKV